MTPTAIGHAEAPPRIKRHRPYPVAVLVLGHVAIHEGRQQKGLGKALLNDAIRRAISAHLPLRERGWGEGGGEQDLDLGHAPARRFQGTSHSRSIRAAAGGGVLVSRRRPAMPMTVE